MSLPTIAKCYQEIVKDPLCCDYSLRKSGCQFKSSHSWALSNSGSYQRGFSPTSYPLQCGGRPGWNSSPITAAKISGEAIPMAILVTDGVGEENPGMVTTFCHLDQAKMEASSALSALHQCDSLEPSVVVVRRYTNTPYIPRRFSHFLYLDISTLSGGTSSAQFPLGQLCLCRLLPYSDTEVVLPWEEGEVGLHVFPYFLEALSKRSTASPT